MVTFKGKGMCVPNDFIEFVKFYVLVRQKLFHVFGFANYVLAFDQ